MKRNKMLAVITAMIIATSSLSACGDVDLNSMTYDETVDYADDYGIEVTIEPTEDVVIIIDETEAEETDVGEDEVAEDETVVEETDVGEEEVAVEEVETKTETTKTGNSSGSTSNGSSGSTSNSSSSGSTTSGGSSSSTGGNVQPAEPTPTPAPATPTPTPTPQPVHTHNWQAHTATKEVWVPNIVIVDDYEDRVTGHVDAVAICNCGYSSTNGDDFANHIRAHVLAGENANFGTRDGYDIIERVIVGSHEEDHGHTETQTYVDYYYCECGETKN